MTDTINGETPEERALRLDARLAAWEAETGVRSAARVVSEPATYRPDTADSFFRDLALTSLRPAEHGADKARERLRRNGQEARTQMRTTDGLGGEFAVPLWAIDKFATAARAGRVIADLVPNLELPRGFDQVNIPIETTSASAAIQVDQNTPPSTVDQVTSTATGSAVVTIAGDVDASQQLFDRTPAPGFDGIVYLDLMRSYNATLERQLTSGSGINGQLTGVTVVTGRQTDIAGSGTSATQATGVATLKPLVGQAMAFIGINRLLPADNLVIAPRRWAWIASDVSEIPQTQNWPLYVEPSVGSDQTISTPAMAFAGLPAYQSASCMTGAATATDVIIAFRSTDMLLYESTPKFAAMENPLSGRLQVRLQLRRYVAFPILKPAGICVVTGLPAPTAFGA